MIKLYKNKDEGRNAHAGIFRKPVRKRSPPSGRSVRAEANGVFDKAENVVVREIQI